MALSSRGRGLLAWTISFTIISIAALCFRFWSARLTKRRFYCDDALIITAFVATMAYEAVAFWGLANGLGSHIWELSPHELSIQSQVVLGTSVAWLVGTVFIKLAILQLYKRIFDTATFRKLAWSLMVLSVLYGITFVVLFITHCIPVDQSWNPRPWGKCRDITSEQVTSGSLNIVIDTAIIILPMPWLWKLQMPLRNKVFLSILFTLGLVTLAVMSIRLYNTIHTNPDPMISLVNIGLLSSLELWLGIVVACMPTMGPLFLTYIKPAFSKVYGRSTDKHIDLRDMGGVNTIGGSGPSNEGRHFRKAYQEIGSSFTSQDIESGDLPLVAPGKATLQTNCEHYERAVPRSRDDGIYVQKQFHTQEF